jgi:hypothetical protein
MLLTRETCAGSIGPALGMVLYLTMNTILSELLRHDTFSTADSFLIIIIIITIQVKVKE